MLDRFLLFLEGLIPVRKGTRCLVAVSGGIDSVVLARLMQESGLEIALAHCNFQMRGDEADADERFVTGLAREWGLHLHARKFDTSTFAEENGLSMQMAARELRYQWFNELCEGHDYQYVATAHHKGDVAETVLINLVRSTGIKGLTGIPRKRENIIRPLLFASREDIERYARLVGLEWREDSSNDESKYWRNLLRNEVMPLMRKMNPEVQEAINRTAEHLGEVNEVYNELMQEIASKALTVEKEDTVVDLSKIPESRRKIFMTYLLPQYGFNGPQVEDIYKSVENTGSIFETASHRINVDRGRLIISPRSDESEDYLFHQLPSEIVTRNYRLSCTIKPAENYELLADSEVAAFDLDRLQMPLRVRNWVEGDRFTPLGMKGTKKVSDFMIDRKIPLNLKKRQLLLFSHQDLAWVIGHQIGDRFKITKQTSQVLEIKMHAHV